MAVRAADPATWSRYSLVANDSRVSERRRINSRPPKAKNATREMTSALVKQPRNRNSGLPGSELASTTPLVMAPKMPMGEKLPPVAPMTTSRPISTGWMPNRLAKPSATGATMATAAGVMAPIAVIAAQTANIAHGIRATRPPTARTAACTIQSTVPLFLARANR